MHVRTSLVGTVLVMATTTLPAGAAGSQVPASGDRQRIALPEGEQRAFEVEVLLDGARRTLHLEPFSIRAPGFMVLVRGSNGELSLHPSGEPSTYRGKVEGWDDSTIAAMRSPRGLHAWIRRPGSNASWMIEPLSEGRDQAGTLDHVVRRDDGGQQPSQVPCTVLDPRPYVDPGRVPTDSTHGLGALSRIEIAFDSDVEFFVSNHSSVSQTQAIIEARVNAMSLIYEVDVNAIFELTAIVIRTAEPDPYNFDSMWHIMAALRSEWNGPLASTPRDTVHMFVGRTLGFPNPAGLAQGVGYLCNTDLSYSLSRPYVSDYEFSIGGQVMLLAHEVGHICGACHCVPTPGMGCWTNDCPDCYLMGLGYSSCSQPHYYVPRLGPVSSAVIGSFLSTAGCVSHDGNPSAAPQLSGVSPARVAVLDGGPVTLTGTHLDEVLYVNCAGITLDMTGFTVLDSTTIEFPAPTGTFLGTAPCSVSGPGGQSGNVNFSYVETYPPKMQAMEGEHFPGTVLTWDFGGRVGRKARVLLSTDPTTTLMNGWPVLSNGDVVQNGNLNSIGLGSYTRTLTQDLVGHDVYVQYLMYHQGQFEASSNITVITVIQ